MNSRLNNHIHHIKTTYWIGTYAGKERDASICTRVEIFEIDASPGPDNTVLWRGPSDIRKWERHYCVLGFFIINVDMI
jgi:hypothetical protein